MAIHLLYFADCSGGVHLYRWRSLYGRQECGCFSNCQPASAIQLDPSDKGSSSGQLSAGRNDGIAGTFVVVELTN